MIILSSKGQGARVKKRGFIFLALVTCYLTLTAYAQQAGQDIAVLKAGVGARPLGMGSAFTAVADTADAPYWNPAGLGFIKKNEITTMQTRLSTDADHYYISYVRPVWGGALGISWVQIGMGNIVQTSSEVDVHNEVINSNIFNYFSNAYMLAFGRELNDKISVGLTAKYLTSDMGQISGGQANGYSVTPGILFGFRENFTVGVKVDELINQQTWGTGAIEQVPPKLRLGLAYQASNPGLFALDVSQVLRSGYSPEASLGYEWKRDGLAIRLGLYKDNFSAGAGFESGHTRLDYAYATQKDLTRENVHRISLSAIW